MGRLKLVLAALAMMAMLVTMAAPAIAETDNDGWWNNGWNSCSWSCNGWNNNWNNNWWWNTNWNNSWWNGNNNFGHCLFLPALTIC